MKKVGLISHFCKSIMDKWLIRKSNNRAAGALAAQVEVTNESEHLVVRNCLGNSLEVERQASAAQTDSQELVPVSHEFQSEGLMLVVDNHADGSLKLNDSPLRKKSKSNHCEGLNSSEKNSSSSAPPKTEKRINKLHLNRLNKFSTSWLSEPDFSKWLTKSTTTNKGHEYAFCKVCNTDITAHRNDIRRHGLTEKHIHNYNKIVSNRTVMDMNFLTADDSTKRAELKLCSLLAAHDLPFSLMDILTPLLKNIFPDSKIAAKIAMKRTKATAVVKESLGDIFKNQLSKTLAQPGTFFSLVMDETTDKSTTKQCAFTITYFCKNKEKVVTRFFDMVEMNSGSSATELYGCLKRVILEKNIPLSNLVGFSSDTTNVMFGEHRSVYALLKSELPEIVCIKCSCHLIHLAASKACMTLPRSVEDLIRNVGSHFSRSAGRQERFKEFQEFFKVEIHQIMLPANTRWLSLKQCVDRILEQYYPLEAYFREEVFRDPSKTTEEILNTFSNKFTRLYLEFMSYTLGLLTDFNKLFQSEAPLLYKLKSETDTLLHTLCANYMKREYVRNKNVFDLDHRNPAYFCPLEEIYLGLNATETLIDIRENALASELTLFLKNCLQFYVKLTSEIKERFVFKDEIFQIMDVVHPVKAQLFDIKSLSQVIRRFPILKQYVDCQQLDKEWRDHAFMDFKEMHMDPTQHAHEYWNHVFQFHNSVGEPRFPNLKTVIHFLLVLPFSNASVERIFSVLNNIKTSNRNKLHTNTVTALVHTKEGVEESGGVIKFEPTSSMLGTKLWNKKL